MESPKGVGEFPAADPVLEVNPEEATKDLVPDPVSSEIEEQAHTKKEKENQEKENACQKLKSGIIISGVAVAVLGAIFAVVKKLREK